MMKKSISKITSLLLVILLAVTAVSLAACGSDSEGTPKNSVSDNSNQSAADHNGEEPVKAAPGAGLIETAEENGVKYELYSDGTLIVRGEGRASIYENYTNERSWKDQVKKVIAEEGITDMFFPGCDNLTEVVIPGSVQDISESSFSNCPNLTKVSVGEGVTHIKKRAFSECTSLADIDLPDTLIYVEIAAFEETALFDHPIDGVVYADNVACGFTEDRFNNDSLTFREGTRIIADYAFGGLNSIKSVTFPDGVVRIGEDAFSGSSYLSEINIPDSVFSIGNSAFYDTMWFDNQPENSIVYAGKVAYNLSPNGSVQNLVLKEGTIAVADFAFDDCRFDSVTLPAGLKWIGDCASLFVNKQAEIVVPDGVTYIGGFLGGESDSLKVNIILPASVTSINGGFFGDVTIIAPKGSYAESYALEYDIPYKEG